MPFTDSSELQRPALLLLGGVVYAAFSSDCDNTPTGASWSGVSTSTHTITAMWSDEAGVGTDQNSMSGIWQSGGGLVSDGPNQILLTTGNGIAPPPSAGHSPPPTLSESVVRLTVGGDGKLTATDYFSPANAPDLDQSDVDLGSGGPIALPSQYFGTTADPDLLVQVGKDGRIFLLNRNDLGGREQGPGQTDDTIETLGPYNGVWGHLAAYGGEGGWVYVTESSGGGYLRALSYGVNGSGVPAAHLGRHQRRRLRLHVGLPRGDEQRDHGGQRRGLDRLRRRPHRSARSSCAPTRPSPPGAPCPCCGRPPSARRRSSRVPTAYNGDRLRGEPHRKALRLRHQVGRTPPGGTRRLRPGGRRRQQDGRTSP